MYEPALTGSSIRKWVLSGGWRDARYPVEPGRGPGTSLIGRYAEELERLACVLNVACGIVEANVYRDEDDAFAAKFGTEFH